MSGSSDVVPQSEGQWPLFDLLFLERRLLGQGTSRPSLGHGWDHASSDWVEWTGGGQSGVIEVDLIIDPLPLRIGEAHGLTS